MLSRISFAIGRETHKIYMNLTATESFWKCMQRLMNSFQIRRPATHRLEYTRDIDVIVQYRPNEQTTNITMDLPEMGSLTVSSVPVSILKLLLHKLSRTFTAIDAQNVGVDRYQISCCRYRSLHMKIENHRIYVENLRGTLQLKNGFSFWRYCPRVRDTAILWKRNAAAVDDSTAAAKEEDFKITAEIHKLDIETFLSHGSYGLSDNPAKIVEASSEDKHTNERTENYDVVANDVHTYLAEREGNGSEIDEVTYTNLDTLEDKGAAAYHLLKNATHFVCLRLAVNMKLMNGSTQKVLKLKITRSLMSRFLTTCSM